MATLAERLAEPDVSALSDAEAASVLNTPGPTNGTAQQDVETRRVYDYLLGTGEWGLIELFSRTMPTGTKLSAAGAAGTGTFTTTDQRVATLINFVRAIETRDVIAATVPAVATQFSTILDGLVSFNFISTGSRTALVAMAGRSRSWAEANGFPSGVTSRDVGLARGSVA